MKWVRLIWMNATRNPRRTVLTVLSITVSIFLVSSLRAILDKLASLGQGSDTSNLRLVVHRATSLNELLPIKYLQTVRSMPGAKYVLGVTWFGGVYKDPQNFFANFAATTDHFEEVYDDYRIPPGQLAAWKSERSAVLVGRKLMEQYGWSIGQRITLSGTIYPFDPELIIRGVFTDPSDASGERTMFFHWEYMDEALGRPGRVGSLAVKAASAEDVPMLTETIDRTFHNTDAETKTETERAFNLSFVSMLGNVKALLNAVSLAVVFTILLVAGNTMAMSIRERAGEVAVLKTLGFRRNAILLLLVGEAVTIALLGGMVGALGAKTTYAFIQITSTKGRIFELIYAVGVGLLGGYGTWMLFAGSFALHRGMKVVRFLITALGALVSAGAGLGFYVGVEFIMNQGGFLSDFRVTYTTVVLGIAIAVGVGIFSATLPALRVSRMSIAEALRNVG
jgi:putative ABC transport system permease protein